MPCYEPDAHVYALRDADEKIASLETMLCGICSRAIETAHEYLIKEDPTLVSWWKEHQKEDSKRKALEEADKRRKTLIKEAKKKLSKAEMEALGIR